MPAGEWEIENLDSPIGTTDFKMVATIKKKEADAIIWNVQKEGRIWAIYGWRTVPGRILRMRFWFELWNVGCACKMVNRLTQ